MKKLNPHILLVMQWLQNPALITEAQLQSNYEAAYKADVVYVADAACKAAYDVAYHARYAASRTTSHAAKSWISSTKKRLNAYFRLSKESKEEYEERARYLNVLGAKND